jgi:hypothetical protein
MSSSLAIALFAAGVPWVAGHGMLTRPVARNVLLNMGLRHPGAGQCDMAEGNAQNMNGCQGGVGPITYLPCWNDCGGDFGSTSSACVACKNNVVSTAEARLNPGARLGVCGDLQDRQSFTKPDNADCNGASCVEQALAKNFDTLVLDPTDNSFEASMTLTAHHWGWAEFRLCRKGGRGEDGQGVTQECFNQDVLDFDVEDAKQRYAGQMNTGVADPSDYIGTSASVRCDGPDADLKLEAPQLWSPPGSCCYDGGDCGNSNTSKVQSKRFVLPKVAAGPEYKVRVRLPAGLSCTHEAPCTLQWTYMTGNSVDSYPEVFRNCADFKLGSADGIAPAPTPTASDPEPQPEPEPEPEPITTTTTAATAAPTTTTAAPSTAPTAPTTTTTAAPTGAPTQSPEAVVSGCVDVQGTECSHCMASNNVCYAQPKAWCDAFSYKWCGATSLLQQEASPASRKRARTQGFLAPSFP